jgi:putative oxidoreductase
MASHPCLPAAGPTSCALPIPKHPAQVRELTQGRGADTVWDCIGGNEFLRLSTSCVRLGGTVQVAASRPDGASLEVDLSAFLGPQVRPAGVSGATRRDQQLCTELMGKRSIEPVIDRTFGLASTADAHAHLA